jgi:asparagine synthase (glutamine-hydrolysing)
MCGIAGYFGSRPSPPERIQDCLRLMERRGPDDHGAYQSEANGSHTLLLHSRLSIIDLDPRSAQPFELNGKRLSFNGELYNYLELRQRLESEGHTFRTRSDTEVLLRVIDAWGWEGLDLCEGMWAFAIYDEADGSLTLCRDRFGEKPLYLLRDNDELYFGSEIKFIRALRGRNLAMDSNHLRRYLVNGYKALYKQSANFFRDIRELAPGTMLRIAASGTPTEERFWTPNLSPDEALTFEAATDRVRTALLDAVKLRLRADVPMAFCMSGGVDSNALISIAKRVFGYDVHGFTILNTDARYEEQDLVERSVGELGIRHTSVPLSKENFLDDLRELVRAHDAPVYTISYFVHWRLMQAIAASNYKISVSGTGADELFTGYYDHHLFFLAHPAVANSALGGASQTAWETHVKPLVRNPFLSNPDLFRRSPGFRDHIYLNADEYAATLTCPWQEGFFEKRYSADNLRNRMLNELFHESVPAILHEDDINAMYFSTTQLLIRDGYAKAVLREAVRGIAPDAVLDSRRKVGFNAPLLDMLDTSNPAVREELLGDSPIFEIVRSSEIERWLAKPNLNDSENKFLFNVLSAKMFVEECAG